MKNIHLIAIIAVVVIITSTAYVVISNNNDNDPEQPVASDYTRLWIVGNANMDDKLDENDVKYIQEIIDGKKTAPIFNPKTSTHSENTNMADVNQDGIVDQKDIDKLKSMISANIDSEKQVIYYVDVDGKTSSMHFPAKTLISTYEQNSKQLQTIHAMDMVIAWDYQSAGHIYASKYTEGSNKIPVIFNDYQSRKDPSSELIISYHPDAILTGTQDIYCQTLATALPANRDNMDIIRISSWEDDKVIEGTLTLGFMICKNAEAQEYTQWADKWLNLIADKVGTLSDDEIVKVLCPRGSMDNWNLIFNGPRSGKFETSELAGAENIITRNLTSSSSNLTVTDEWVKSQSDLDFIVAIVYGDLDNQVKKVTKDPSGKSMEYTNKSFYDTAVKYWSSMTEAYGTQVHVLDNLVSQGTTYIIGVVYMAKWFYPELFADMNPDTIFQEFMDNFFEYDFDCAAYQANGGIAI